MWTILSYVFAKFGFVKFAFDIWEWFMLSLKEWGLQIVSYRVLCSLDLSREVESQIQMLNVQVDDKDVRIKWGINNRGDVAWGKLQIRE